MFKRLFGSEQGRQPRRSRTRSTTQIVAAARQPVFYADWDVPDTPLGRFEMMSLHMFLVLHRLRGETGAAREVAQDLTDAFFADVDHSMRELGIGDVGVPKRMKKLARMFYGRAAAYGDAVERGDAARWPRRSPATSGPDDTATGAEPARLRGYALAADRRACAASRSADHRAGEARLSGRRRPR